jgi:ACS family D-galactonate transporter-like MFS transporter
MFTGLLIWLATTLGWRSIFYFAGGAGVLFGLCWYFIYQDPLHCKRANAAELRYIEDGGALLRGNEHTKFDWKAALGLLRHRQILAICLGKFCSNSLLVFFTTWFLTYLVEERKMTMIKVGFFQALPFLGATAGILLAGFLSDLLIRRGVGMSPARKAPLIIGTLLGTTISLANYVTSDWAVIAILTTAFFAQGVAASSWAAVSEIAPRQFIGLTSGITSLAANLAGVSTPLVIGYILHATGSFYQALNFIGMVSLLGTLSYSLLLGPLHRIEIDEVGLAPAPAR